MNLGLQKQPNKIFSFDKSFSWQSVHSHLQRKTGMGRMPEQRQTWHALISSQMQIPGQAAIAVIIKINSKQIKQRSYKIHHSNDKNNQTLCKKILQRICFHHCFIHSHLLTSVIPNGMFPMKRRRACRLTALLDNGILAPRPSDVTDVLAEMPQQVCFFQRSVFTLAPTRSV